MNEPTPKKDSDAMTWAQAVVLSVLFACVAAVCIVGIVLGVGTIR